MFKEKKKKDCQIYCFFELDFLSTWEYLEVINLIQSKMVKSTEAVEYTDCLLAKGYVPLPKRVSEIWLKIIKW